MHIVNGTFYDSCENKVRKRKIGKKEARSIYHCTDNVIDVTSCFPPQNQKYSQLYIEQAPCFLTFNVNFLHYIWFTEV
jgi:hypothetical protein